jgi:hypothetical protein
VNGSSATTSALVAMVGSSCSVPSAAGRNTDGSTSAATAVDSGETCETRCGLNPEPRSSTPTTSSVGSAGAVGGGEGGGAGTAGEQAARSTTRDPTTNVRRTRPS